MMHWSKTIVLGFAVGILSSCSTVAPPSFDSVYTPVQPSSIQPGQPIPSPTDEILIRITGDIHAKQIKTLAKATLPATVNDASGETFGPGQQIELDRENLESIGLVEYDVLDPFEKKTNRFRGILIRDLLALAQASPDAETVALTALNDYHIKIPIALLQSYPILLATHQNGVAMKPDYRGPAMLIAPYEQYPAVDELANPHYWIWQVTHLHIE